MHEVLIQLLRLARGTWRYRWWMLGVAWIICLVGWTMVARLPDQYRASARVFVDTSSVLAPYLKGLAINPNDTGRRVSLMTRTLLSRPNLEKVMRMTDLDLRAVTNQDTEEIIRDIRRKMRFRGAGRANLYTITYTDESPELAKLMVKSLLTIFMESNLGESRKDQDSASQFLEQQLDEYDRRIQELEGEIARHRHENYDLLPGDSAAYYKSLRNAKKKLAQSQLEVQIATDQLAALRAQLEGEEPAFGLGPQARSINAREFRTPSLDKRINAIEVRLDDLLVKYTDRHPDVITSRRKLADLKAEREEKIAELKRNYVAPAQDAYSVDENPVYQQLRLSALEIESGIAAKKRVLAATQERLRKLEGGLEQVLEIDAKQNDMQQELAVAKRNYAQLLTRLESAKLGRKAQDSTDSVRFRVIDPPQVPSRPSGPNRIFLSSGVLGAGLLVGFALAFLMSQLRPTYDDRQMMNDALGLAVLGSVNMVWTSDQVRARKVRNVSFVFTLMGLLMAFAIVLALYQFNIDLLPRLAQSLNLA